METFAILRDESAQEERAGGWILTASGKQFWPEDPRPEDVCIEDVAHALSLICRFTGHCARFYSVAEHSLLVAHNVPQKYKPWALLHDAAEAYVSDLAAPLKRSKALAQYRTIEGRVLSAILERFGLHPGPEMWMPPAVKDADLRALMTEKRDLMPASEFAWSIDAEPFSERILSTEQYGIKASFLAMAKALGLE